MKERLLGFGPAPLFLSAGRMQEKLPEGWCQYLSRPDTSLLSKSFEHIFWIGQVLLGGGGVDRSVRISGR